MDELVYLDLLEEVENVEEAVDGRENAVVEVLPRDAVTELTNQQFVKLFRLSKVLFEFLVESLTPFMSPKKRPTDLDIPLKILAALRFYASGSYQMDIGSNWFLGLSQSSISRTIHEVTDALNSPNIFNEWIKFPRTLQEMNALRLGFYQKFNFPGVIGCIDCTHVAIFPPNIHDPQYPEHLYVNRKNYHSINVQLICDANLKIININAKYPGSTNDAFIWNTSNVQTLLRRLHRRGNNDYYLLGDSGYPLRNWLLTPLEEELVPNTPDHNYNTTHKRTRCSIERCNGVLKARFRCCLKHRVLHYKPEMACKIINACAILHNLCIEHNVAEPDEELDMPEIDFGMIDHNVRRQDIDGNDIFQRVNPELTEGRNRRRQIIHNFFA